MGKFNYLFSRNCAFGITTNSDGSYSIFTRGVDRVQYRSLELLADFTMSDEAFGAADNLWNAFQDSLVECINYYKKNMISLKYVEL